MNGILVFVYGTLRSGQPNHHRHLANAECLGEALSAPRYTMVSLGGFPGVLAGGETAIHGEVYRVDAPTLARLDELEGHPHFYARAAITIPGVPNVVAYLLPRERFSRHEQIESGDWTTFKSSRVR